MHDYIAHYKKIANDYREVAPKKREALGKATKILKQQKHADATELGEVVKLKVSQNLRRYKPQQLDRRSKEHRDNITKILGRWVGVGDCRGISCGQGRPWRRDNYVVLIDHPSELFISLQSPGPLKQR